MLMKALRVGLGQLIVLGDALSRPRRQRRSAHAQAEVVRQAARLSLYQFHACPFCVKTRRALHRLNVPVTLHDIRKDTVQRERLLAGGGKVQVPAYRGGGRRRALAVRIQGHRGLSGATLCGYVLSESRRAPRASLAARFFNRVQSSQIDPAAAPRRSNHIN